MVFDIPTLIALVALTCFCWAGALAWMARQRYRELFWWAGAWRCTGWVMRCTCCATSVRTG